MRKETNKVKWLKRLMKFGGYTLFTIMCGVLGYQCIKFLLDIIIIGHPIYKWKLSDFVLGAFFIPLAILLSIVFGVAVYMCICLAIRSLKEDEP